jgi:hypothetical protein
MEYNIHYDTYKLAYNSNIPLIPYLVFVHDSTEPTISKFKGW